MKLPNPAKKTWIYPALAFGFPFLGMLMLMLSRSTANGLDEAASAAQEALFICVQNCDERHLRDIKALS